MLELPLTEAEAVGEGVGGRKAAGDRTAGVGLGDRLGSMLGVGLTTGDT